MTTLNLDDIEAKARAAQDAKPGAGALIAFAAASSPDVVLELVARVRRYEHALETIAQGSPMPETWGEQPQAIDAYHRAVAEQVLKLTRGEK